MATFRVNVRGRSLLGSVLLGIVAIAFLFLLFFFLAAAAAVGVLIGAVVVTRLWWAGRKLRKAARQDAITTEYTVIEREAAPLQRLPDEAPSEDRDPDVDPGNSKTPGGNSR